MLRKIPYFLFVATLFINSCGRKTIPDTYSGEQGLPEEYHKHKNALEQQGPEEAQKQMFGINADSIHDLLERYVNSIAVNDSFRIDGSLLFSREVLPAFYKEYKYQPAWNDMDNRREAINLLTHAWQDGLNPEEYHADQLINLANELIDHPEVNYAKIAQFDILLTDGILLYAFHLLKGKLNPESIELNWNFPSRALPANPVEMLDNALIHKTLIQEMHALRPQIPTYDLFVNRIQFYHDLKEKGGWSKVSFNAVVHPGEFNVGLKAIRERLMKEDFLHVDIGFLDSFYDDTLAEAVKKFQVSRGLNPDGIIGEKTIAAMNVPVDEIIDKLRINMERARWVFEDISSKYIVVNIAGFKMYIIDNGRRIYETKVMVGKSYTQTPVFRSTMRSVVFNPTWTVPVSIAAKEILPSFKKDPNYLTRHNMVLLDGSGNQVEQDQLDLSKFSIDYFPFTVIQNPGTDNALGNVKFLFPNKYAVYLHDTPSKYLFEKEQRAFSHGCIRVQNPLKLAELLLDDPGKWNDETIEKILATQRETTISLRHPVDVMLLYWTAGMDAHGNIVFYQDIYDRDKKVLEGIENKDWNQLILNYRRRVSNELFNNKVAGNQE